MTLNTAPCGSVSAAMRPTSGMSIGPFITAGIVLLAAWIMDIGRETSDAAAALRKEAELVV